MVSTNFGDRLLLCDVNEPFSISVARLRNLLIVFLVAAMPITRAIDLGGKQANLAASDLILPFGIVFLVSQALRGRIRLPLAGACCLSICSFVLSILANWDLSLLKKGTTGSGVEIGKIIFLWIHFYLIVNLIQNRRDLSLLLKTWLLSSGLVALSGIAGSVAYQTTGVENSYALMFRAQGTLGDCNLFAAHLALSFVLTLLYRRLSTPVPLWTLPLMLLQITGILFSASRGGMLAFALSLTAIWTLSSSLRTKVAGAALTLCAALFLVALPDAEKDTLLSSNPVTARLATFTVSLQDEQAADRKELWQGAWNQIAAAPIFGMGRGNYGGQVHNTALEILCETGMLGLVSYAILAYWSVAGLLLERWSYPSHEVATGARILLIALMTVGVSGMTISIENYRGLWVLFGVGELYRRLYRDTTGEWMAPDMAPIRLTPDTRARIVS